MAFSGFFDRGFSQGFANSEQAALQQAQFDLNERAQQATEEDRLSRMVKSRLQETLSTTQEFLKNTDARGIPRDDPRVVEFVGSMEQNASRLVETSGLFDPQIVSRSFQSVLMSPTPDQLTNLKAQEEGAVTGARERAKAEVGREFERPIDEQLERIRLEAKARAQGTVSGGGGPKATVIKNIIGGERETARQKKAGSVIGEAQGSAVANSLNAAQTARSRLAQNQIMRSTLSRLQNAGGDTGALAPTFTKMKALLQSAGIDLAQFGIDPDTVASAEAIQSMTVGFALEKVEDTKGPVSDAEMALFMVSAPSLAKSTGGNKLLLEISDRIEKRKIEFAKFVNDKMKEADGDPRGFQDWANEFQENNPLFTEAERERFERVSEDPPVVAHPQAGIVTESMIQEDMAEKNMTRKQVIESLRNLGFK